MAIYAHWAAAATLDALNDIYPVNDDDLHRRLGALWLKQENYPGAVREYSAVVALLMPVALGIATQYGMDPRVMAPVVALPSGLAFTLPVGTPGNAIAYSSGYLRLRDMLVPGSLMVFVAWVLFNLAVRFYWPLIGLSLVAPPTAG